ncbi:MAG TPA: aminotransferase class III-fold pyridoxal phosphate-dependent enzyme [Fibrobacteraceae bacterium]|nr:aminotransferase class III-fold pyridoxal phosphate-dependent enzyme [Fibrobacteraceae bacterium]
MNPLSENLISSVWTHATTHIAVSGSGCRLRTTDGRELLDFTSGIGVNSTGHCHPHVVQAIQDQVGRLLFSQINCLRNDRLLELAEKLREVVPSALDRFFFSNSGAEAVEAAVKLAKHATGKSNVVVMQGSFHGRTHLTMAMTTSKTNYRLRYAPLPGGIYVAPYPYALALGMSEAEACQFSLAQLDQLLHTQSDPSETACIVVEPVLGEGGYVPPPDDWLEGVRKICDQYGILMVVDEIQSGFGRSGKWFAHQYSSVVPDIMTMAKGLGSGMPISGIAYKQTLQKNWVPGSHGGTYGGGPLACAAAIATVETLLAEHLVENAQIQGERLMAGLRSLQSRYPVLADVRGRGLMVGAEFLEEKIPLPTLVGKILQEVDKRDLMLLSCGIRKNVVRWIPPLIVTAAEIDDGLARFEDALKAAVG